MYARPEGMESWPPRNLHKCTFGSDNLGRDQCGDGLHRCLLTCAINLQAAHAKEVENPNPWYHAAEWLVSKARPMFDAIAC